MNLLSDIITYVRRLVKTPSNSSLSSNLITDYINRFWIMDVDERIQLFDLKTKYQFQTIPGIADYNMPLYTSQTSSSAQNNLQSTITPLPVYQGFLGPAFVNGFPLPFYTDQGSFSNLFPLYTQQLAQVATGDGSTTTFSLTLPYFPAIPGHVDLSGIISTGSNTDPLFDTSLTSVPPTSVYPAVFINYTAADGSTVTVTDSGQFLSSSTDGTLYGLLMIKGSAGGTNTSLGTYSTTSNTVNYATGAVNVTFPSAPPDGTSIQAQCYFFSQGLPRGVLFFNNTLRLLPPPNTQYLVELDAYLTPAAFLSTSQAIPFAYMAEYVARGAARKLLSDTGDVEQFQFYEPLFREQEQLVLNRSERQFTSTRQPTIYTTTRGLFPYNSAQGPL